MPNSEVIARGTSFLEILLPQQPLQRLVLYVLSLCLVSSAIGITVIAHVQSNRILLVSNTADIEQSATPSVSTKSTVGSPTISQGTLNAAKTLVRIDQSIAGQYANDQEHDTWSASTCSAASMAEIINAYKDAHYRITDILAVEAAFQNPQVISADSGLLYLEGIDRTMGYFGFMTTRLHPTLEQLIARANAGTPVLINFPSPAGGGHWDGGHFLVVVGGDGSYVHLADSSKLDMQYMTHDRFLYYWKGFADVFTPTNYSVMGKPTVSADFMNKVLAYYHSPAQGKGQALYDLGIKYGIDPAFALSFFGHESTFGTKGEARLSLSLGNLRCISAGYEDLYPWCQDDYAWFHTWEAGFEAFYRLMAGNLYNASGLVTPDQIIPRYAPSADNNDETAYISALKRSVDRAHTGQVDIEKF